MMIFILHHEGNVVLHIFIFIEIKSSSLSSDKELLSSNLPDNPQGAPTLNVLIQWYVQS